jgi:DNA-directed RNA polymerase specialized sigma24 family protein
MMSSPLWLLEIDKVKFYIEKEHYWHSYLEGEEEQVLPEEMDYMTDHSHVEYLDTVALWEAVDCLPEDQQAIIALITAGFKQTEICTILEVSRTTIWSKKLEALASLKILIRGKIKCPDTMNA